MKRKKLHGSSDGGKTLLFVNLSPMASDVPESIGTMRFGENVAKCVIAKKKDKKGGGKGSGVKK